MCLVRCRRPSLPGPKGRRPFPAAAPPPAGVSREPAGCTADEGGPGPTALSGATRQPATPAGSLGTRQVGGGSGKAPQRRRARARRQPPRRGRPPAASSSRAPAAWLSSQRPGAGRRGAAGPSAPSRPCCERPGEAPPPCLPKSCAAAGPALSPALSLPLSLFLF